MGRVTLDKNPDNWFVDVEQPAFSPSNMVPGIAPSPDAMLQARIFAYPDAQRYRLGVNYNYLPTNAPKSRVYCPIERDGKMNFTANNGSDPNYIGTSLKPVHFLEKLSQSKPTKVAETDGATWPNKSLDHAQTTMPSSVYTEVTDADFKQRRALWKLMGEQEGAHKRLIDNAAAHISGVTHRSLRERAYQMFGRVDEELGRVIQKRTETKIENNDHHPHKTAWH